MTNFIYEKPARIFAENYSKGGGNIYVFKIYSGLKTHHLGAAHCFDLPLIFANESAWKSARLLKDIPWEHIHENGKKLRALWAEFARNGVISDNLERPEIVKIHKV